MRDKLVLGVGVRTSGMWVASVGGKPTKEYRLWSSMLKRCYSKKSLELRPTYKGCSVSEEFTYFQKFVEWASKQIGFDKDGYHLDKDILVKGNKIYSRDTCVFVPSEVNTFLTSRVNARGDFPIGVYYEKGVGKYKAQAQVGGKRISLGRFYTPEQAFLAYKVSKENLAKDLAVKYNGLVDPRVIKALENYSVEITD